MLKNAYVLAKIGADTAKNEQHSAEILRIGIGRSDTDHLPGEVAAPLRPAGQQEKKRV